MKTGQWVCMKIDTQYCRKAKWAHLHSNQWRHCCQSCTYLIAIGAFLELQKNLQMQSFTINHSTIADDYAGKLASLERVWWSADMFVSLMATAALRHRVRRITLRKGRASLREVEDKEVKASTCSRRELPSFVKNLWVGTKIFSDQIRCRWKRYNNITIYMGTTTNWKYFIFQTI